MNIGGLKLKIKVMKIYAKNKMVPGITFLGMVEKETELYITVNGENLFKSDYNIDVLSEETIIWYYFEC